MSIGFHIIADSIIVFRQKCLYKQGVAYQRNGNVYCKVGSGYARLLCSGQTTHPDVCWLELEGVNGCPSEPFRGGGSLEYSDESE